MSSNHENETLFVLKVFPGTKATEGQVTSVTAEDRERTASPATNCCDGTDGDDEPVQRLFVCRECKAFFNDTTSLFEHQKLHKTQNATQNNFCDDSTARAKLSSSENVSADAQNADKGSKYKTTGKNYLALRFVTKKANDQLVICKAVGVSRKNAKDGRSEATCEMCRWSGSDSDLSNHLESRHSTVSFECAACGDQFREYHLPYPHNFSIILR